VHVLYGGREAAAGIGDLLRAAEPHLILTVSEVDGSLRSRAGAAKTTVLRTIGYVTALLLGAWLLHALALWLWHLPILFRAALLDPFVHILQHGCFFGSALAYWRTVDGGGARNPTGTSIVSLITTMLHTSALERC
jgi:cytochrome c oxidase assembly factor CtaG